jgi:hypothetical protein
MAKSESRQQQLLAGQSAISRKVFDTVPIQESWSVTDIYNALRASNVGADSRSVRRCLFDLRDIGLIREPSSGQFQRSPTTVKSNSEPVMITSSMTTSSILPLPILKKPAPSALDALAGLSAEVIGLSEEIGLRMKKLAARIEEVALSVEAEREVNAESLGKLKQLQSLLKGIAQ